MKYCVNCGNQLTEGSAFCTKCGMKLGAARTSPPPPATAVYNDFQDHAGHQRNTKLLWGIGIFCLLFVAIGGGYYFSSYFTEKNNRVAAPAVQNQVGIDTKTTVSAAVSSVSPAVVNDFRIYVQAKERFNSSIIELATQVNVRLGQDAGLRYSHDLRNRASGLVNEITQYNNQLAAKQYPVEMQNSKVLLQQLLDLEMTRARSLYNGLTEGINGQNFQSSFSVGTSAAYQFDEVNGRFVQEYGNINAKGTL